MRSKDQEELDNYFQTIRLKNEQQSKVGPGSKKRK
jgi:hypothetical protein